MISAVFYADGKQRTVLNLKWIISSPFPRAEKPYWRLCALYAKNATEENGTGMTRMETIESE